MTRWCARASLAPNIYLVLDGVIRVERDGERLAEYGPGALQGERAHLEGGVRTSSLIAVTACKVAAVDAGQFDRSALEELSGGHRREDAGAGLSGAAELLRDPRVHPGGGGRIPPLRRSHLVRGRFPRRDAVPTLILDAGTGLREVTSLLAGLPFAGTILLSHLHWDHLHGLPFFRGGDTPGARVTLLLPEQEDGACAEAVLERGMSPPHFPIRPRDLRGAWTFGTLAPGLHVVGGFTVQALEIPHKGGRTFGYRISDGSPVYRLYA